MLHVIVYASQLGHGGREESRGRDRPSRWAPIEEGESHEKNKKTIGSPCSSWRGVDVVAIDYGRSGLERETRH